MPASTTKAVEMRLVAFKTPKFMAVTSGRYKNSHKLSVKAIANCKGERAFCVNIFTGFLRKAAKATNTVTKITTEFKKVIVKGCMPESARTLVKICVAKKQVIAMIKNRMPSQ